MKNTSLLFVALLTTGILWLCGCQQNEAPTKKDDTKYTATNCPACCDTGCRNQSPVNIKSSQLETCSSCRMLDVTIRPAMMQVTKKEDNGHANIHATPKNADNGNYLMFKGTKYDLAEFHFHDSSEHAVDSVFSAMEMHIVYQNAATGTRIIIGLMMARQPGSNAFIERLWQVFAAAPAQVEADLNAVLSPRNLSRYYTYTGSLTTPKYQDGATWFVLKDKLLLSDAQIMQFRSWHIGHPRELQSITNRFIFQTAN